MWQIQFALNCRKKQIKFSHPLLNSSSTFCSIWCGKLNCYLEIHKGLLKTSKNRNVETSLVGPFPIFPHIDMVSVSLSDLVWIINDDLNISKTCFSDSFFTFFWLALMVFSVFAVALIWVAAVKLEAVLTNGNINANPFSFCFRCLRNQKLTIVNSTSAAKTKAVHKPIHTSMACKQR